MGSLPTIWGKLQSVLLGVGKRTHRRLYSVRCGQMALGTILRLPQAAKDLDHSEFLF